MALDLSGKRAVITAAGSGIGQQTVKLFSKAGAKIFICDIDEVGLHSTISGNDNVDGMISDVSDPNSLEQLFKRADDYLGGLDFLVNNAGTAGPTAPIEEVTLDDWHACLTVNLTSTFLGTQHAIPRIKDAGGGGIINMSSAAGKFGFSMRSPYVASKWAIVGLTRTTALEVGPFGIRCNCIQPGPVEGERINRVIRAKADAEGVSENQTRDEMVSITSLRSFVPPNHVSGMILYLCSDMGATITGQAISVDSGLEGMGD